MGSTYGGIHIKIDSGQAARLFPRYEVYSLSPGWSSFEDSAIDATDVEHYAKEFSNETDMPVLCALYIDDDQFFVKIFQKQRIMAQYTWGTHSSDDAELSTPDDFVHALGLRMECIPLVEKAFQADVWEAPALFGDAIGCFLDKARIEKAMQSKSSILLEETSVKAQQSDMKLIFQETFPPDCERYYTFRYPLDFINSGVYAQNGEAVFRFSNQIYRSNAQGAVSGLSGVTICDEPRADTQYNDVYALEEQGEIAQGRIALFTPKSWDIMARSMWKSDHLDFSEFYRNKRVVRTYSTNGTLLAQSELPMHAGEPLLFFKNRLLTKCKPENEDPFRGDCKIEFLTCWDAASGKLLWQFDSVPDILPIWWNESIYFGTRDFIIRISPDGEILQKSPRCIPDRQRIFFPGNWRRFVPFQNNIYYFDYIGGDENGLIQYDATLNHKTICHFSCMNIAGSQNWFIDGVIDQNGYLYFPLKDEVKIADVSTGEIIHSLAFKRKPGRFLGIVRDGGPVIQDGKQTIRVFSRDFTTSKVFHLEYPPDYSYQNRYGNCCIIASNRGFDYSGSQTDSDIIQIWELTAAAKA